MPRVSEREDAKCAAGEEGREGAGSRGSRNGSGKEVTAGTTVGYISLVRERVKITFHTRIDGVGGIERCRLVRT
jgi:hypothetical protein